MLTPPFPPLPGSGGGGGGGGSGSAQATLAGMDPRVFPVRFDQKLARELQKIEESLHADLAKFRAGGKVSPALLDDVRVEVEGEVMPLRGVAQVSVKDAATLQVQVFDEKLAVVVEAAIRDAGLGLMPNRDGKMVRVPLPKITHEYRETMVKKAKEALEDKKGRVRRVRQKAVQTVRKAECSEDDTHAMETYVCSDLFRLVQTCSYSCCYMTNHHPHPAHPQIQAMVDVTNAALETQFENKSNEVLGK